MTPCEICHTPCKNICCSAECKVKRRRRIERAAYAADPNPRQKVQNREYYQRNSESIKARMAEYRRNNPTYNREYFLMKKYGLSVAAWDALLIEQSGRCGICSDPMESPVVDHDHDTGEVRGLLCSPCNTGIGHLKDDIHRLEAAVKYLSR